MRHRIALALLASVVWGHDAGAAVPQDSRFDAILRKHVEAGRVDYDAIKAVARGDLDAYVVASGKAKLDGLSKKAQLAFLLNAYNALVIKAVVDRRPGLKSVMKVPGFFKRFKYRVAGRMLSLDELENKLIRPRFKDARVHFALVCAARSCPPLPARAYRAATLDKTLDGLARRFINSRYGVRFAGGKPQISKLFEWYADDFRAVAGSVGKYLAKYHQTQSAALAGTKSFGYLSYDWSLNSK